LEDYNNKKNVRQFDDPMECLVEYQRVRPWFLQALSNTPTAINEPDIIRRLAARTLYLHTTDNAAILVEYVTDPYSVRWLNVYLTAGEKNGSIETIKEVFGILFELAEKYDHPNILGYGRNGWKKVLEPLGFITTKIDTNYNKYELRRQ